MTIRVENPKQHWQKAVRCPNCNMLSHRDNFMDPDIVCIKCGSNKRYWCSFKEVTIFRNRFYDRILRWIGKKPPIVDRYFLLKGSYKKIRIKFHWTDMPENFITWEISE